VININKNNSIKTTCINLQYINKKLKTKLMNHINITWIVIIVMIIIIHYFADKW